MRDLAKTTLTVASKTNKVNVLLGNEFIQHSDILTIVL